MAEAAVAVSSIPLTCWTVDQLKDYLGPPSTCDWSKICACGANKSLC